MIPYHCDICDTKFVSTAMALKYKRRKQDLIFIRNSSIDSEDQVRFPCGDSLMFLQNRFLFCQLTGVFKTSLISSRHRAMIKAPC